MNEQYIQDLYNNLGGQAKFGGYNDFKSLIQSDQNYRNDFYNAFGENTLGAFADFESLVKKKEGGLPGQAPSQQEDTESNLGVSSSASPSPQASPAPYTGGYTVTATDGHPVSESMPSPVKESGKIDEVSKTIADKSLVSSIDFDKSINEITPEFINRDEDAVASELNSMFKDYGIDVSEATPGLEAIKMTAPNPLNPKIKDEITIGVDAWTDKGNSESSREISKWIGLHQPFIKKKEEEINEYQQRIRNDRDLDNANKSFNNQVTSLNKEYQQLILDKTSLEQEINELNDVPENQRNSADYINKLKEFEAKRVDFMNRFSLAEENQKKIEGYERDLKISVGRYEATKSEQGGLLGLIRNNLIQGVAGIDIGAIKAARTIGFGIEDIINYATGNDETVSNYRDTNDKSYMRDFVMKAIKNGIEVPSDILEMTKNPPVMEPGVKGSVLSYDQKMRMYSDAFKNWKSSIGDEEVEKINNSILNIERSKSDELSNAIQRGADVYKSSETTKEYEQEGIIKQSISGLAASAPSMLMGEGSIPAFFLQGYGSSMQEMENDADFNEVSPYMKAGLASSIGVVNAVLEEYGFRNALSKSGIINNLAAKALTKAGKTTTATSFKNLVENEVESAIAKGLLTFTAAGISEAETGAAQYAAETGIKKLYNIANDKDMFSTPETAKDFAKEFIISGVQEAIGGHIMGTIPAIATAYSKNNFNGVTDDDIVTFRNIANDTRYFGVYANMLKASVAKGTIKSDEANRRINDYRNAVSIMNSIPENMTPSQQRQALGLILERKKLESEKDGKEPSLVKKQSARIDEINAELGSMSEKVPTYSIDGKEITRSEFVNAINNMTPEQVKSSNIQMTNPEQKIADLVKNKSLKKEEAPAAEEKPTGIPKEISSLDDDEQVTFTVKTLDEVPEEFRDRAKKLNSITVELRKSILGIPIGPKTTEVINDGFRYVLTGKEVKDYAIQKQGAEGGVLRPEGPEVGLQEVGQGDQAKELAKKSVADAEQARQVELPKIESVVQNEAGISTGEKADKILFLDVNGVIKPTGSEMGVIPQLISHINRIIDETGAKVVISSDERTGDLNETREKLKQMGFKHADKIIGETSVQDKSNAEEIQFDQVNRGDRVMAWKEAFAPDATVVALDDNDGGFKEGQQQILVSPNMMLGVTDELSTKAIEKLNKAEGSEGPVIANNEYTNEVMDKLSEMESNAKEAAGEKPSATTTKEAVDNGVSMKDKTQSDSLVSRTTDTLKARVVRQAIKAVNTVKSIFPNFDIVLHENEDSFNNAMSKYKGNRSTAGNIARITDAKGNVSVRIDINLDRANMTTVAHEVSHAVMLKAFGDDPELFSVFRDRISKVLSQSRLKELNKFASQYNDESYHEEFLVQLSAILSANKEKLDKVTVSRIMEIINKVVSKITGGAFVPFKSTSEATATNELIDFFNRMSESIAKGEKISESEIKAISDGLSINLGDPEVISKSSIGEPVKFSKTPSALSFVTDADKIDIYKLINEIIEKKQKVWFWMADQLGRGYYSDEVIDGQHYLDAGPSFALDPENRSKGILWASGSPEKTLSDQIKKADYIFFISGSPEKAKLFNKSVLMLIAKRIESKSSFNAFKDAINSFGKETNELKTIKKALSQSESFDDLANSNMRKDFLLAIDKISKLKTAPEGSLKALLSSFNVFIDLNELRDGFYRENGFNQNDIMLVGKPTSLGGKAPHSTYKTAILGDVVGVPDKKIDAWDIMPDRLKNKYKEVIEGKESKTKPVQTKIIAAEAGVVRRLAPVKGISQKAKADEVVSKSQVDDIYHGSPYDFERFTTEKIGTGEGAQAFGWGLYFTDVKEIAEYYADVLTKRKRKGKGIVLPRPEYIGSEISDIIKNKKTVTNEQFDGILDREKKRVSDEIKKSDDFEYKYDMNEYLSSLNKISSLEDIRESKKVYQVSLHQGKTPDQYTWLEWDKPISRKVDRLLYDYAMKTKDRDLLDIIDAPNGKELYERLVDREGSQKNASLFLLKAGIDGNKYPAESISRGTTSGTARGSNYVVFDENAVTIVSKSQKAKLSDVSNKIKESGDERSYMSSEKKFRAFSKSGLIWHGGESKLKNLDVEKIKGGSRGELGYGFYFSAGSKAHDYGRQMTFLDASNLNLIDGEARLKNTDLLQKLKDYIDYASQIRSRISRLDDLLIKSKNNKEYNEISSEIDSLKKELKSIDKDSVDYAKKLLSNSESSIRNLAVEGNDFEKRTFSKLMTELGYDGIQVSDNWQVSLFPSEKLNGLIVDPNDFTAKKYLESKESNSNPELVKAVEDVIGEPEVVSKSQKAEKLSEANMPGYDATMKKIGGIIAKVIAKSRNEADRKAVRERALNDAMNYLQSSKLYENATDVQREQLVRDLRNRFYKSERSAPSAKKILGIKATKITMDELELLKKQFKDMAKGARSVKKVQETIAAQLNEMVKSGKITLRQMAAVVSKFSKINTFNEDSISKFIDYMENVFSNAEYVDNILSIKKILPTAKKNIMTKLGIAEDLVLNISKILNINPTFIPADVFNKYMELVNMLGKREKVLTLKEIGEVTKTVEEISDAIKLKYSLIDDLSGRLNDTENKVYDENGKFDYAKTVDAMLEKGEISAEDADVMRKNRKKIYSETKGPSENNMYERVVSMINNGDSESDAISKVAKDLGVEESLVQDAFKKLSEEKESLIGTVYSTANEIDESVFPTEAERSLARKIKKLLNTDAIEYLNLNDIKNVIKMIDNIKNGYISNFAKVISEKLDAVNDSLPVSDVIPKSNPLSLGKMIAKIKTLISKDKNFISQMIKNGPLYYIDQVLGDFKTKTVYNAIFEKASEALQQFEFEVNRIHNILDKAQERVAKSFDNDHNMVVMSKFKMMTYMLELEYQSNPDSKQVNPAIDFLKETLRFIEEETSFYTEKDAEVIREIIDKYEKGGGIDIDKLYKSFNDAEKDAIRTMQKINESMKEKAVYTSVIIRGEKISPVSNYVHHNVITKDGTISDLNEKLSVANISSSMMPSTRAKSLMSRTGAVTPLNLDPFASVSKGTKAVLMDYHLTSPVRTARRALNQTRINLKKNNKYGKKEKMILNAIESSFESALENILSTSFDDSGLSSAILDYISKQGYRAVLASATRSVSELTSNLGYALWVEPEAMIEGIKHASVMTSEDGPLIMNNVKSKVTSRQYPHDSLSGKLIDTNILNQVSGIKGSKTKGAVANVVSKVYNNSVKKYINAVELTSDVLISTPDKLVSRPIWFGTLANEFKRITGQDINFEKIAQNDEKYMADNEEAINIARNNADEASVRAASSNNGFMASLKGKNLKTDSAFKIVLNRFNTYLTNFMIYEYITARTGLMAAMGNGMVSRGKGARMIAGVTTRMMVYTLLTTTLAKGLSNMVLGNDDDDEEDERSMTERVSNAFLGAASSLMLGRDFGNVARTVVNYGIEKVNQKYLDGLRDGKKYDAYKDAITYSTIPVGRENKGGLSDMFIAISGPFSPMLKTIKLSVDKIEQNEREKEKKKEARMPWEYLDYDPNKENMSKEMFDREVSQRIPLEFMGNLGLIPFYKDVHKIVNESIYRGFRNSKKESEAKKAERDEQEVIKKGLMYDEYNGIQYESESDMRYRNKDLYEQRFGPRSDWYRANREEKISDAEKKAIIDKLKDEYYHYTPSKKQIKARTKKETIRDYGYVDEDEMMELNPNLYKRLFGERKSSLLPSSIIGKKKSGVQPKSLLPKNF